MPILIQCPQCQARMNAPDGSEGRKAKCPRCGTLIPILRGGDSSGGGEEEVAGGEDAGLFAPTKKSSGARPAARAPREEDEDDPPVRKGRKIVEEDEDDVPVRKGRKVVEDEDDNVVAEDDDAPRRRDDEDDEDEDDRPRKRKKKKKKRRRGSGPEDVDPALIENGWNMIKGAYGLALFGWCCCIASAAGAFMSLGAVGIGISVMVKGDAATGIAQVLLGGFGFLLHAFEFIVALALAAAGNDG